MAGTTVVPPGRQHKRTASDQQKRRELALQRQKQGRRDLQHHARQLALSAPTESEQHEEFAENQVRAGSKLFRNFFFNVSVPCCDHICLVFRGLRSRDCYLFPYKLKAAVYSFPLGF